MTNITLCKFNDNDDDGDDYFKKISFYIYQSFRLCTLVWVTTIGFMNYYVLITTNLKFLEILKDSLYQFLGLIYLGPLIINLGVIIKLSI